ncbi:MAG: hypothetical protein KC613_25495, partial [Myxococcales bacterium]|nr:hypothetical protein [Myxococcales bacterium]
MPEPQDVPAVAALQRRAGNRCGALQAELEALELPQPLRPALELAWVRLAAQQIRGKCADSPVDGLPRDWEGLASAGRRRALRLLAQDLPSSAAQLALAAAYYGLKAQAYGELRAAVEVAKRAAHTAESPSLSATALRFEALLWQAVGQLRRANTILSDVERTWRQEQNAAHLQIAQHSRAKIERESGRYRAALELLRQAHPPTDSPHLPGWLHSVGWTLIAGRTTGDLPPASALIDTLEALAEQHYRAAGQKEWLADTFSHRAWNAWLDGDLPRAARWLDQWRAALPDAGKDHNVPFALALDGRIHAAQGDCAGAWALAEQVAHTDDAVITEADWRARQVAAEALDCAGDPAAALTRRQDALDLIDAQAAHTEVTAARGAFLAAHRDLVDGALGDALRLGAVEHAFALADAVQARVVRGLRTDARLDALPEAARTEWLARRGAFERARAAYRQ